MGENQQSNQTLLQPVPVYIPTPKHILEARKTNGTSTDDDEAPNRKRPKLEYVPKAIGINQNPIPTYIPSSLNSATNSEQQNASNLEYEPTKILNKNDSFTASDNDRGDVNGDDIIGLLSELSETDQMANGNQIKNTTKISNELNVSIESNDVKQSKETTSKENRHKNSSSSRHRHHSSSHRSSHSDRKSSSSSRSSSSSHRSSHHSSSRKSKHSDKDLHKPSSSSSSSKSSSKHKSSEHRRSSSSSSSSRHRSSNHSSDKRTSSSNNNNNSNSSNTNEDCANNSIIYEEESEDDDVEAQCRMIFEEFDPETIDGPSDEMIAQELESTTVPDESDDGASKANDAIKKKRIAHENADKQVKLTTTVNRNINHVKNAMQVGVVLKKI